MAPLGSPPGAISRQAKISSSLHVEGYQVKPKSPMWFLEQVIGDLQVNIDQDVALSKFNVCFQNYLKV